MAAFDATLRPPAVRITCASAHNVPPANSPSMRCAALRRRGKPAATAAASKSTPTRRLSPKVLSAASFSVAAKRAFAGKFAEVAPMKHTV